MDFVYPKEESLELYEIIMSSFHEEDFVRINTKGNDNGIYDSFLMAVSRKYQDLKTKDGREKMKIMFIEQFKKLLEFSSFNNKKDIHDRIMKVFHSSNLSRNFEIKNQGKSEDIFDIILVEKELGDGDEKKRGFSLFPKKLKKKFNNISNFFDMISNEFLKEIIEYKLSKTELNIEIRELKKLDPTQYVKNKLREKKEVLDFMKKEENNLDPSNLLDIIDKDDIENHDLILKLLSEFMNVNVYICRPWNTEFSVIKKFYNSKNSSNIIIFKIEGRVSLTGINKIPVYETGGLKTRDGIVTVFHSSNTVIDVLHSMYENNLESYYMEKYLSYLTNIEHQSNMCELEMHYCYEENEEKEENEESGEKEEKEESGEIVLLEETHIKLEVIIDSKEEDRGALPFIKNYTSSEILDVLERENKGIDYSGLNKKQLEINYSNMFHENKNMDTNTIIQNIKSRIV